MKFVYPAIFTHEDDGSFSVNFPDIQGAHTCGKNLAEAIYMAGDCLGINLLGIEEDKLEYPEPSSIANFKNTENQFATLISLDMTEYKKRVDEKPIRKTLYVPKYLNDQAERMGVNFSDLLRQALSQRLSN